MGFEVTKRNNTPERTVDGGYIHREIPMKKVRNHWEVTYPDKKRKYATATAAVKGINWYLDRGTHEGE